MQKELGTKLSLFEKKSFQSILLEANLVLLCLNKGCQRPVGWGCTCATSRRQLGEDGEESLVSGETSLGHHSIPCVTWDGQAAGEH